MNGKIRVAAIGLALAVLAGLVLLLVRPGINPAPDPPAAAADGRVARVHRRRLAAAEGVARAAGGAHPAAAGSPSRWPRCRRRRRTATTCTATSGTAGCRRRASTRTSTFPPRRQLTGLRNEFLFYPRGEYCVTRRLRQPPPGRRARPGLHQDQPADRAHHLPAGRRGVLPRRALPAGRQRLDHAHPGHHGAGPPCSSPCCCCSACARLGRDMRMAALWSWCPTVALEAGNSAHVDVVAVGIAAAARAGAGHGADHPPDRPRRDPARPGHRDQADARPGRARGAAAPLG